MAAVKTTIDKFGRRRGDANKSLVIRGPPGIGFNLTTDNHFDIQNKRLKNIGDPIHQRDSVNRIYVDKSIGKCMEDIKLSYIAFMENQMSLYSKFIYDKITEMIGEVRQYIHKEIYEVKKLAQDNYNTLSATVKKVEHTVQESVVNKTPIKPKIIITEPARLRPPKTFGTTKLEAERVDQAIHIQSEILDVVGTKSGDLNSKNDG